MKPYKLKHVPTGLYYQPHKHRGSNLSKRGKIYQTGTHGLSSAFNYAEIHPEKERFFTVYVEKDSQIHKLLKDIIVWKECTWSYNQMMSETLVTDWIIEEI